MDEQKKSGLNHNKLIIGSRGSALALYQANLVKQLLNEQLPELLVTIKIIKTKGDIILDVPLAKIGDKGLFTKELEVELVNGSIDIAVHSLKDLPTRLPDGIALGAVLPRGEVRDVLISRNKQPFDLLPEGAVVGTSSLRRISQLKYRRPDLKVTDMRGNVDSRIKKVEAGVCDAIILAGAGVTRLGLADKIAEYFDTDFFIPAVSQGIIGIESRENDARTAEVLATIHDVDTAASAIAERAFLRTLEGGCQVPLGCYTRFEGDAFTIKGFVASHDGETMLLKEAAGPSGKSEALAINLALSLLDAGAKEILDDIRTRS